MSLSFFNGGGVFIIGLGGFFLFLFFSWFVCETGSFMFGVLSFSGVCDFF